MHEPRSDKVMPMEHESVGERRAAGHVEREVRLDAARKSEAVIRERISGGFYHTLAVVDFVARRIVTKGEL